MATRKRSTSFRGEQNAPPVPKEIRRKPSTFDISAVKSSRTIKQTIAAQISQFEQELEIPRRLTNDLQTEFEKRSQELLAIRKDDMAIYRSAGRGRETLLLALALYRYFETRDATRASYHELEFHMKALVDDVLNRLFADVAAPPVEGQPPANAPGSTTKTKDDTSAKDPWADF
jgi:hypothetical protein